MIADFIIEFTLMEGQGAEESLQWSIHMNGSSNKQASRASVVFHNPKGDKVESWFVLISLQPIMR